jgi:hypothetical protein
MIRDLNHDVNHDPATDIIRGTNMIRVLTTFATLKPDIVTVTS